MTIKSVFQKKFGKCELSRPQMCKTDGIKSPMVFCVDKICQVIPCAGKRCDEIVLCDTAHGVPGVYCIENKDQKPRQLNLREIEEQLQGGADIVEERLADEEKFLFLPIFVNRSGVPETYRIKLQKQKIRLRNIARRIRAVPPKLPLPEL